MVDQALLSIEDLAVHFPIGGGLFSKPQMLRAVDGVNLSIKPGESLGLVTDICRRVCVMYAGRIVEQQDSEQIFNNPQHPYTQGLVASLPRLGMRAKFGRRKLTEIAGVVPGITAYPAGCRFNPRCDRRTEVCTTVVPELETLADGSLVRCHHHG